MPDLPTTFGALGDRTRLAIVERLIEAGELSAGELQGVADITAPAISRHLKVLREAGLVIRRVDAQRRMYRVNPKAVGAIARWSLGKEEFWSASLDRLAAALDRED